MWKPITTAPTDGQVIFARDSDGLRTGTWYSLGDWLYPCYRENEDQEEFLTDEVWNPVEWWCE